MRNVKKDTEQERRRALDYREHMLDKKWRENLFTSMQGKAIRKKSGSLHAIK